MPQPPRLTPRPFPALVALLLALSSGCERERQAPAPTVPPAPAEDAPDPARAEPTAPPEDVRVHRAQRRLMGTVFVLTVIAEPGDPRAVAATDAAYDEIARLEALLSEWRPESEVSRINAAAGDGRFIPISPAVAAVLRAGLDVSRRSGGAFDLSWAALHGLYRFPPNPIRWPTPEELAAKLPLIDHTRVLLRDEPAAARLKDAGMAIGTGGIAKGYALDRAGAILEDAGFPQFMLFGGGQVQVHGKKGNRPWRVGIQHPRRPADYFAFLEVDAGSISTSGDYEHFHVDETGRRWHHLIDPRTGEPARGATSVTMLAPSGVDADALSTACFIRGPAACLEMLANHPDHPEAVIVDSALRLHTTPGTRDRLTFTAPLGPGDQLPPG